MKAMQDRYTDRLSDYIDDEELDPREREEIESQFVVGVDDPVAHTDESADASPALHAEIVLGIRRRERP